MIIYIEKDSRLIKMHSNELMDLPQFDIEEVDNEELDGFICYYKNGEIIKQEI